MRIRWTAIEWPLLALWLAFALSLSQVTGAVKDWFVMTDELVYERLAISIAKTGSPLPHIHDQFVRSLDQLYPLLIAPFFRHGLVSHDIHEAHLLNAWVMTSACIPAFLLARRVTGRRSVAYLLAILSVTIPWFIYAPFLLTEVVAYPAVLWALLAFQSAIASPSDRNDLFALLGIRPGLPRPDAIRRACGCPAARARGLRAGERPGRDRTAPPPRLRLRPRGGGRARLRLERRAAPQPERLRPGDPRRPADVEHGRLVRRPRGRPLLRSGISALRRRRRVAAREPRAHGADDRESSVRVHRRVHGLRRDARSDELRPPDRQLRARPLSVLSRASDRAGVRVRAPRPQPP